MPRLSHLLTAVVALQLSTLTAHAEYRLQIGDRLEFSVLGMPTFSQSALIDGEGSISIAPAGRIEAAGRTLEELEQTLKTAISTKPLRIGPASTQNSFDTIDPQLVTLALGEYRPVYIDGDVQRPGSVVYRPGLSVRQAIALAGGFGFQNLRVGNPLFQSADLRSQYETSWLAVETERMHIARLEAERAGSEIAAAPPPTDAPVTPENSAKIAQLASETLALRRSEFTNARDYLARARETTAMRIKTLEEQQKREEETAQYDAKEVERIEGLFNRRVVTSERLTDARRVSVLSDTRALQVRVQAENLKEQEQNLAREEIKLRNDRDAALLAELEGSRAKLSAAESELRAVREKLFYLGLAAESDTDVDTQITIVRKTAKGAQHLGVGQDEILEPGDVMEVALRSPTDASATDAVPSSQDR